MQYARTGDEPVAKAGIEKEGEASGCMQYARTEGKRVGVRTGFVEAY